MRIRFEDGIKIHSASLPFPALADAASGIGSILFPVDPDGKIRRAHWRDSIQGKPLLSLTTELARRSLGLSAEAIDASDTRKLQIGEHVMDLQSDGNFYLNFIDPSQHFETVSFADVLANQDDPALFQDKIVLIGATAIELRDIWASPLGLMPGLEIQANSLQTLLSGRAIYRIPLWVTFLLIFANAAILDGSPHLAFKQDRSKQRMPFGWFSLLTFSLALLYGIGVFVAFTKWGLILDLIPVLTAILVHHLLSSYAMNLAQTGRCILRPCAFRP
ncbi:MAG: CHASE2 domain-containing protein [Nitrospiria bacterium]